MGRWRVSGCGEARPPERVTVGHYPGRQSTTRPIQAAWFASPFNLYEGDPYDPNPERVAANQILTFKPPKPQPWFQ